MSLNPYIVIYTVHVYLETNTLGHWFERAGYPRSRTILVDQLIIGLCIIFLLILGIIFSNLNTSIEGMYYVTKYQPNSRQLF